MSHVHPHPSPMGHRVAVPPTQLAARLAPNADQKERELLVMLSAFRLSGGLVTGDALANMLQRHEDQSVSTVARWLVNRSILNFSWHGQSMIPLFQFERTTMRPIPGLLPIIRELRDAFDDWEASLWFATPNAWLDQQTPLSRLHTAPDAVFRAAQADRYIARGQ